MSFSPMIFNSLVSSMGAAGAGTAALVGGTAAAAAPALLSAGGTAAAMSMAPKPKVPKIDLKPATPPRGAVSASGTAAAERARLASRGRYGGTTGLILSAGNSTEDSKAQRTTLLGR